MNPIYNFLLRYYNIRGASGTRRLARWTPGLHVVLENGKLRVAYCEVVRGRTSIFLHAV